MTAPDSRTWVEQVMAAKTDEELDVLEQQAPSLALPAGIRYERVTYRPEGGRRRHVTLEVVSETAILLVGFQVDSAGERVEPSRAVLRANDAEYGEVQHVMSLDLVEKREPLVVDRMYGTLVPAGTETPASAL